MDTAAADECRRCYAKIGDWATEEGQAQGTECLATYEPNFAEMCGEKMQAFAENPSIELRDMVDECWEECNMRRIAEKCLETTGGADKDVEGLCMFKHMNDNLRYAKLKVYGEEFNPLGDENAQVIESIFEEGRCEHANNGNNDRRQECNMCFNHVMKKSKKMQKHLKEEMHDLDDEADQIFHSKKIMKAFKKISSMWMFCADNYLAPTYADCFETVEDLYVALDEGSMEDWQKKILEMQGCMMLKQSQYYFEPCKEGAGEGVDGLMSYMKCSRNMTMQWVTERRPESADDVLYFMTMGGNPMAQMDMDDM